MPPHLISALDLLLLIAEGTFQDPHLIIYCTGIQLRVQNFNVVMLLLSCANVYTSPVCFYACGPLTRQLHDLQ